VASSATPTITTIPTPTDTATQTVTPIPAGDTPTGTPTPTATPLCGATPRAGCRSPGGASLLIRNKGGSGNVLSWKWLHGDAPGAELGDPRAITRYGFCVYDAVAQVPTLKVSFEVAPGGTCGDASCWSERGGGTSSKFRFVDSAATQGGAKRLLLKGGKPGKDKLLVRAGGAALSLPAGTNAGQSLAQDDDVTVQLVNDVGGCWESVLTPAALLRNQATLYKAKN